MEKTFPNKTFFNHESYLELIRVVEGKAKSGDEMSAKRLKWVEKTMDTFRTYVETVDNTEEHIRIVRFHLEGDDLRDAIMRADMLRRSAHEAAIGCVASLRRFSDQLGIEPVFNGNADCREEVADFCLEVDVELFKKNPEKNG